MVLRHITFDRLFPSAVSWKLDSTQFGFESSGKRYFSIRVPGQPRLEEGMSVIALLETPDGVETDRLLGWVDCRDGTLVHESIAMWLIMAAISATFGVCWAPLAYRDPAVSEWVAVLVAVVFGSLTLRSLFVGAKAALIRRSLAEARDAWTSTRKSANAVSDG